MSGYWDTVKAIAEEIHDEYPDPDDDHNERADRVHEDVDGSQWIIYYNKNDTVLNETHNYPDDRDVREMAGDTGDWKKMRTVTAFLAMEADVYEVLKELDDEAEDEEVDEEELEEEEETP
jgi:hypothetical protein